MNESDLDEVDRFITQYRNVRFASRFERLKADLDTPAVETPVFEPIELVKQKDDEVGIGDVTTFMKQFRAATFAAYTVTILNGMANQTGN